MRGTILGYDAGAGVSVVRGEDGRRYAFAPPAWREQRPPRKGDLVDFEPHGDRAEMVFLLANPKERERSGEPGAILGAAARHPALRTLLERPVLVTGILVLLACFASAYRVGNDLVSLYAVPDLIAGFARALEAMVGGTEENSQPRTIAGFLRIVLVLQLLLYAVPILAARAVWKELAGRPAATVGRYAGLAAMTLPIVLPLLVIVPVHLLLLPAVEGSTIRLGGSGIEVPRHSFDVLRFYGTGTILLLVSGLALWASATGRFQPLGADRKPDPASATGVSRNGPASFGPPSVRKDDAEEQMEMVLPTALQRRQGPGRRATDRAAPAAEAPIAEPEAPAPETRKPQDSAGGGLRWPRWPSRKQAAEDEPVQQVAPDQDFERQGRPEPTLDSIESAYLETGEVPPSEEESGADEIDSRTSYRPDPVIDPPLRTPRPAASEPEPDRQQPRASRQYEPEERPERPRRGTQPTIDQGDEEQRRRLETRWPDEPRPGRVARPDDESAAERATTPPVDPRDWRRFEADMEDPLLRRYVPRDPVEEPAEPEEQAADAAPEDQRARQFEAWEALPAEPARGDEWEPEPQPQWDETTTEPDAETEPEPEPRAPSDPRWREPVADAPRRQEETERRRPERGGYEDLSMLANDLRSALESEIGRSTFSTRRQDPPAPSETPERPARAERRDRPAAETEGRMPQSPRQAPAFSTRDTSFSGLGGGEERVPTRPYRPFEESPDDARRREGPAPRQPRAERPRDPVEDDEQR